mmetsp:Transcript_27492/g.65374  ORF Transcript_27492/g.65374 Transcript_27492/m.65374 type:complete len:284 (-) Transcript_27492:183-1034(-)
MAAGNPRRRRERPVPPHDLRPRRMQGMAQPVQKGPAPILLHQEPRARPRHPRHVRAPHDRGDRVDVHVGDPHSIRHPHGRRRGGGVDHPRIHLGRLRVPAHRIRHGRRAPRLAVPRQRPASTCKGGRIQEPALLARRRGGHGGALPPLSRGRCRRLYGRRADLRHAHGSHPPRGDCQHRHGRGVHGVHHPVLTEPRQSRHGHVHDAVVHGDDAPELVLCLHKGVRPPVRRIFIDCGILAIVGGARGDRFDDQLDQVQRGGGAQCGCCPGGTGAVIDAQAQEEK